MSNTYISFLGGNGGGGGGGGGGPASAAFGSGTGTNTGSRQNGSQENVESGTTDPGQSMLLIHREHLNIDIDAVAADGRGYMTTVPTIRLPKRLVLMANGYNYGGNPNNFTFMIDILLVPLSFNVQTWTDLYLEPFNPNQQPWFMGVRRLRDNIILLRRFAAQGEFVACAADQFDIPEDIRNRSGYRLVVTCPVYQYAKSTEHGLCVQLEMES